MNLFKRLELWILLAIVAAGLAWVFSSRDQEEEGAAGESGQVVADDGSGQPLVLHRSVVERDYGNARLDLEVRIRNAGSSKITLQPPQVRLTTGDGREIPPFFLPFEPQPEIAPTSTQDVKLRYWLEKADLQGALSLEVNGSKVAVKSATPFDLETLKTKEQKTFRSGEW